LRQKSGKLGLEQFLKMPAHFGCELVRIFGPRLGRQQSLQSAFALDHPQGIPALAHGALAEHLAGDDEIGAAFRHVFLGLPEKKDPAVDAGVHAPSVAVPWGPDDLQVIHSLQFDHHLDSQFPGRPYRLEAAAFVTLCAGAERRGEVERNYLDTLVFDELSGEDAVKSSREQGYGLSFHCIYLYTNSRSYCQLTLW